MENKEQKEEEVSTPSELEVIPKSRYELMLEEDTFTASDKQIVKIEMHATSEKDFNATFNIKK